MEERKYTRVQHKTPVELHYNQQRYQTVTEDLSLRGMKVRIPSQLDIPVDTAISLYFKDGDAKTEVDGKIAFRKSKHWGIVFTHIGENSLKNLISLLQKRAPDKDSINDEVSKMVLRVCD